MDSFGNLVEITKSSLNVEIELRYASCNNLLGKPIYQDAVCYLHKDAVKPFEKAIKLAEKSALKFKIWDAFRPFGAQKFLYRLSPEENIFSNPKTGEVPHCRGVALDLTLISPDGEELDMGTDFDDLSVKAFHKSDKISRRAQKNRSLLRKIMIKSGWEYLQKEWWHYQLPDIKNYPIIYNSNLKTRC